MSADILHLSTLVLLGVHLLLAILLFFFKKTFFRYTTLLAPLGSVTLLATLWISLERPPLRTLGETRLWYACLLPLTCFLFSELFKLFWLYSFSLLMACLFLLLNIFHPEVYDKTLAPALQSPWFIPHVIVYILSYALIGAAFLMTLKKVWLRKISDFSLERSDLILRIGFFFLTCGLVFGAFWAKTAWGSYWTWDPKETWALLTWAIFLLYFHYRYWFPQKEKMANLIVLLSFVILLVCWFGLNALSIGQNSVHTYTN